MATIDLDLGKYKLGWSDPEDYVFKPRKGLNEEVIREMSALKKEPEWMLAFRFKAYRHFLAKPMMPWFAEKMPDLDFDDIYYYIRPTDTQVDAWEQLPDSVKQTYEKLGIPEAERKYLAGVTAQYESEVVYHRNREELAKQGVLFSDMDSAVREYPDIVRRYFGRIIPPNDNKFAALNSAVWSGGSFIYVPPGVKVEMPLQAYFRINAGEHGSVRADSDHRRRRCAGPLRGRLLRAGLHERLPPLGGRRTRCTSGESNHVYDDPELVK